MTFLHVALQAIVNEDHNDDASMLRQKVRRLQQELALARALAAKVSPRPSINDNSLAAAAAGTQAAGAASQQLFEHGQQLEQALEMLSDLGKRNKELEEAAEFYQWCGDGRRCTCPARALSWHVGHVGCACSCVPGIGTWPGLC